MIETETTREAIHPDEGSPTPARILILSWMLLFGMIGTGLVGPNLAAVEREFGIGHGQFGLAFALIQLGCSVAVLGIVSRLRALDPRTALLLGLGVQVAGFAAAWAAPTLPVLAAGWSLVTLGTVLGSVANNVSARLWASDPRRGVNLLHGFNGVGKVAGPLLAGLLLGTGWRTSFLAVGAITLGLLALFCVFSSRLPGRAAPPPSSAPKGEGEDLRRPFYWLCVLPFGLIAGGDVCFAALLPAYYEQHRSLSPELATSLLTIHLVGLVAGRFFFVWTGSRLGNNRVILLCLASGLSVLPAWLGPSFFWWALGSFGVGWLFSSTWPTYYAQVARFFPHRPHLLDYGTALGNAAGIAVCVFAAGALAERWPPAALLTGPAALALFGCLYVGSRLSR